MPATSARPDVAGYNFARLDVGALAMHGFFDLVHGYLIPDPGVPSWWPTFCLAYDVVAAAYLAWLLSAGKLASVAN